MACLDVGCGAADTTFELARRVGDRGRVVGIDIDEAILDGVRGDAPDNVELRVGDIRTIEPIPEFDLVNARFVLDHLARPWNALAIMKAMLRPGGMVCAECGDYSGWYCYPHSASFDRIVEFRDRAADAYGRGGGRWRHAARSARGRGVHRRRYEHLPARATRRSLQALGPVGGHGGASGVDGPLWT